VLNGRNGSGKSTVLDAIDFAITGTINKFASRNVNSSSILNAKTRAIGRPGSRSGSPSLTLK
jgi:DNA repair exonuclease SbcCD ATPase subunit